MRCSAKKIAAIVIISGMMTPLMMALEAQSNRNAERYENHAALTEISPDTGRMLPAYSEWSRYRTFGMCLAMMRNVQHLINRSSLDTVNDSVSTRIPKEARANTLECTQRFDINKLDRDELWAALRIALAFEDDEQAIQIVDRQMQLASGHPVFDRAEIIRRAIDYATVSQPPRERIVRELIPHLRTFGDSARPSIMLTYLSLVNFYANTLANGTEARRFADSAVVLHRQLDAHDMQLGLLATNRPGREASMMLMKGAAPKEMLSFLTRDTTFVNDPFFSEFASQYRQKYVAPIGTPVPSQFVSYLYSNNTDTAVIGTTVTPKVGVYSLWTVPPNDWRTESKSIRLFAAMLRGIQKRYGRNADITLFVRTAGYLPGSGPLSPQEEAEAIRRYFWETHKLQVNLAVAESPMQELPDGRRVFGAVGFDELFGAGFGYTQLIVVDQHGNYLRLIDAVIPGMLFDNKLADALTSVKR